jgi:Zn-dependent peptidase ImmA (M78 family)
LREEECEEMGDKTVRLTLAHELGHLIYNFDLLEKIDWLNTSKTSNEEEEFSWEFAYYLISEKSRAYASPSAYSRFHYGDQELKKAVRSLLNKKPKPVRDAVIKTLGLPNP